MISDDQTLFFFVSNLFLLGVQLTGNNGISIFLHLQTFYFFIFFPFGDFAIIYIPKYSVKCILLNGIEKPVKKCLFSCFSVALR